MIEAIERLVEQITTAEETLVQAKKAEYVDDETRRTVIERHQSYLKSQETVRFQALQSLQKR